MADQKFIAGMENGTSRRPRVSQACVNCRLKKARCDKSLPCARFVQHEIPCIRRDGRKSSKTKSDASHDMLVEAVHTLYGACTGNTDVAEVTDVTTRAILESLNLVERTKTDSEAKHKYSNINNTKSPKRSFTNFSLSPSSSNSEARSSSDSFSSTSHQTSFSSGSMTSVDSLQCTIDLQKLSMKPSTTTQTSGQSLPTMSSANDFQAFEPLYQMPPLLETESSSENGYFKDAKRMKTAPVSPYFGDLTSGVFNDFTFQNELAPGMILPEQNQSAQGDFDFDAILPLSERSIGEAMQEPAVRPVLPEQIQLSEEDFGFDPVLPQSEYSFVTLEGAGSMYDWHNFDTDAGLPPSTFATDVPKKHSRERASHSTVPPYHSLRDEIVSPAELGLRTESEHGPPKLSLESDKSRRISKKSVTTLGCGTHERGCRQGGDSTSAVKQPAKSDKRRLSLEKNRRAAAKCRDKKRSEITQLKEVSRDTEAENSLLKQQTTQMQEEILKLRSSLLTHLCVQGCRKPEEVKKVLDEILDRSQRASHL